MTITVKKYKTLPLVVGESYPVIGQPGQTYTLHRIVTSKYKDKDTGGWVEKGLGYEGVYDKCQHLGVCPLRLGGLQQNVVEDGTHQVCDECGTPVDQHGPKHKNKNK